MVKIDNLDKSIRTRKKVCRSAMKRCSRLKKKKSYYGLYSVKDDKSVCFSENGEAMTNDGLSLPLQIHVPFFFIVKNRTKKCPAAAHGKKPGKNRESLLDFEGTKYTLCSATLIQLSVTCLFCSLELLRSVRKWGK